MSNKGAIYDFVLSPANSVEHRVVEDLFAVEAIGQARQPTVLAGRLRFWLIVDTAATGPPASLER